MQLPEPVNVTEHLLYGINQRLDVLIQQMNSLVEVIGKQYNIPLEIGQVKTATPPRRTRKA